MMFSRFEILYDELCNDCQDEHCIRSNDNKANQRYSVINRPVKIGNSPFYTWKLKEIEIGFVYPYIYETKKGAMGVRKKYLFNIPTGAIVPLKAKTCVKLPIPIELSKKLHIGKKRPECWLMGVNGKDVERLYFFPCDEPQNQPNIKTTPKSLPTICNKYDEPIYKHIGVQTIYIWNESIYTEDDGHSTKRQFLKLPKNYLKMLPIDIAIYEGKDKPETPAYMVYYDENTNLIYERVPFTESYRHQKYRTSFETTHI